MHPTVTKLSDPFEPSCERFRLEGGDLAPGWVSREGNTAWCEVTVWFRDRKTAANEIVTLGSYGGGVWPGAWPELFDCCRGSAQSGPYVIVKPAGLALLAAADEHETRSLR